MRKPLDAYYTPVKAVDDLKRFLGHKYHKSESVLEPCCGTKNISNEFEICTTVDIDPSVCPTIVDDMSKQSGWDQIPPHDWVITNPPFTEALNFARLGLNHAKKGMALMLRLSFLEPTYKRQEWLANNPPHEMLVLPRISFTGDGKTDSVTVAWMIWHKFYNMPPAIQVVRKD